MKPANSIGYAGPIEIGMRFLWEPDLPHATTHLEVTRITGPGDDEKIEVPGSTCVLSGGHERRIWTRSWGRHYLGHARADGGYDGDEVWNDESRFREAVVPVSHILATLRRVALLEALYASCLAADHYYTGLQVGEDYDNAMEALAEDDAKKENP